jgi:excisionase family DNA binding protein
MTVEILTGLSLSVMLRAYAFEASVPFVGEGTKSSLPSVNRKEAAAGQASEFLTRSEVSKLLGVSPNTVTRWAREGRLPCQVTLGGHHRFNRELVEQLRKSLYRAGGRPD